MATQPGVKLSEAEMNAPDLDDDGEFDVEHYPLPACDDPKLKAAWDEAMRIVQGGSDASD